MKHPIAWTILVVVALAIGLWAHHAVRSNRARSGGEGEDLVSVLSCGPGAGEVGGDGPGRVATRPAASPTPPAKTSPARHPQPLSEDPAGDAPTRAWATWDPLREARTAAGPAAAEVRGAPAPKAESPMLYSLDREGIRAAIQDRQQDVADCYRQWVGSMAGAGGKVKISFKISPAEDGKSHHVVEAHLEDSDLAQPFLEGCILNVVSELNFAPNEDGESTRVTYPFIFRNTKSEE